MSTALFIADTNNPVSPDNFNTYEQTCNTADDLRAFTGVTGVQVYMRGVSAVNDGGQGVFYWNAGVANPVDDNVNTIVPNGSVQGCWSRLTTANTTPIPVAVTGTNAIIMSPLPNTGALTSYTDYQLFSFVTAGAPTGAVTAQYSGLAALPVYLPGGSQAGSGAFLSQEFLMLAYVSSFNSGGGGFIVVNGLSATAAAITQVAVQVFTTSGTYTPTAGMVSCVVEAVGSGGGGGGSTGGGAGTGSAGAGGGGGGYAKKVLSAATVGVSKTITINAAGPGGASAGGTGGNGGSTTFGSILTANGGSGGSGALSYGSNTYSSSPGSGGTSTGGDINMQGESGFFGMWQGTTPAALSGGGGDSFYGTGGQSVRENTDGNAGTGYGSGGAGAASTTGSHTGGPGTTGVVIVTEFISV